MLRSYNWPEQLYALWEETLFQFLEIDPEFQRIGAKHGLGRDFL